MVSQVKSLALGIINMPYKCAFGCTSYNPNCDACDSETTSDNPYDYEKESNEKHKAALRGMTRQEWLDSEDNNDA